MLYVVSQRMFSIQQNYSGKSIDDILDFFPTLWTCVVMDKLDDNAPASLCVPGFSNGCYVAIFAM